jgi:cell division protein FtsW
VSTVSEIRLPVLGPVRTGLDMTLILTTVALLLIGMVMIVSASIDVASARNGSPMHYGVRHGIFVLLGMLAGLMAYQIPVAWWQKSSWLLLGLSLLLLLIVILPGVGKTVNGSTRWISFGSMNFQPSELAKLFLVAYLAAYLVRREEEMRTSWWGFTKPLLVLGLVGLLLLAEPDFGAAVVIGSAFIGMMFLGGARIGRFLVLLVASAGAAAALIYSSPYRLSRLTSYIDPWRDQFGSGYQLTQSLIAFGRGEVAGVGLGNSIQKQFYLPEAHTDFVLAILAEEFGLIGTLAVIALFAVLVYRALAIGYIAERIGRCYAAYLAYGIALLIGVQAFINMGVTMGLLPTKGLTLPLVSYGGSSLIVTCASIGLLVRIHRDNIDTLAGAGQAGEHDA